MASVLEDFSDRDEAAAALEPRDRALARAIVRTTVRRRGDIDFCLDKLMARPLPKRAHEARAILRTAAAQLLFMRQADHAAVDCAVALLKGRAETGGYAGLANAVLRRLAREGGALLAAVPVEANIPDWLWRRWSARYGAAAAGAIAEVQRTEPPLDIAFVDAAAALPEGAQRLPTGGARLATTSDVTELEGFAEGAWWVQDLAAQLPALMLGDVAGQAILDMCAAPGGKAMQLAARGAKVTAVEIDPARAGRLRENLARTRLAGSVRVLVEDARALEGTYDGILLDAPCSSTGTMRRQPDVGWSKSLADVNGLAAFQRELLRAAAARLAPGGLLVYATCSLEPEEGEAQLDYIAADLPELSLERPGQRVVQPFLTEAGTLRTLPSDVVGALTGLDGFFAARLRKSI